MYSTFTELIADNNTDLIQFFIESGADVNQVNNNGWSILHYAANGYPEIIELLLSSGANINQITNTGISTLHVATQGHYKITKLLLACGANINHSDNDGRTSLHFAIEYNELDIAKLLLVSCDLDIRDNNGETALHLAIRSEKVELSYLLLNYYLSMELDLDAGLRCEVAEMQESNFKVREIVSNIMLPKIIKDLYEYNFQILWQIINTISDNSGIKKILNLEISNIIYSYIGPKFFKLFKDHIIKQKSTDLRTPKINQLLDKDNLLVIDVPGDGNCFFHAVAKQLKLSIYDERLQEFTGDIHDRLRSLAIHEIETHRDQYRDFFYLDESLEIYLQRLSRSGVYADGVIIQALANALDIAITIENINSDNLQHDTIAIGQEGRDNLENVHLLLHQYHYQIISENTDVITCSNFTPSAIITGENIPIDNETKNSNVNYDDIEENQIIFNGCSHES